MLEEASYYNLDNLWFNPISGSYLVWMLGSLMTTFVYSLHLSPFHGQDVILDAEDNTHLQLLSYTLFFPTHHSASCLSCCLVKPHTAAIICACANRKYVAYKKIN
jgi:hypothetical protein